VNFLPSGPDLTSENILQTFKVFNASVPKVNPGNWQLWPNAVYKNVAHLADESDENIFTITYFVENKIHFGNSDF
jgi:hypothetical protein